MSLASHHPETPAADASKLLIRLGLAILMVALPCAGVVTRGAIYVLMPVGAILILIGAAVGARDHGPRDHGPRHLGAGLIWQAWAAALFLAFWSGLSLVWTPFPAEAIQRCIQLVAPTFLVALVAAYLSARTQAFDLHLLPVGVALSAVATLFLALRGADWFLGASEFDDSLFGRSMITSIVLVWPALGALSLSDRWIAAAVLAMLVAAVALAGFARFGLAAMGIAAFVFALAMSNPDRMARVLGWASACLIFFAPALPLIYRPLVSLTGHPVGPTAESMLVWADLITSEWARLITGHGFDAANRGLSLGYLPELTPRSILFVIWYDLGVIGAAAAAFLMASIFTLAGRLPPIAAPSILAGLVAILTLAVFGVAAAQIWWMTLIDCAIVAFIILIKGIYRTQRPPAPTQEAPLDLRIEDLNVADVNAAPVRSV
jgi:hypothetical protein